MPTVSFKTTKEEIAIIDKIVGRAEKMYERHNGTKLKDRGSLLMDITACHANGCPLQLQRLLDAPDFDFSHDVFGINRHINRETGQLEDCFLPRTARKISST